MTWYFTGLLANANGCLPASVGYTRSQTGVRPGGYCVTLDDLLPLLPSGPGGVCRVQLHSPPSLINGESGIRTHGGVSPTHAFQACSLNHSDISPVANISRHQSSDCITGLCSARC